jgi:hypothetical protein
LAIILINIRRICESGRAQAAPARLNPLYSQSLAPLKNFL